MAGSTNFPTALDSHTNASPRGFGEVFNQLYTTLTVATDADDTTFTVASTAGFPTNGILILGTEIVHYAGTTGTTFTNLNRGVEGTSAASHGVGTIVGQAPTAAMHNDLAAAIVALETYGTVQTAYASGVTSAPTTTSGSYVDMTDMSVSMTTLASSRCILHFTGVFSHSNASVLCSLRFLVDGGQQGPDFYFHADSLANGAVPVAMTVLVAGFTAAAHTYKVQWLTSSGTLTAYTTARTLTIMETRR